MAPVTTLKATTGLERKIITIQRGYVHLSLPLWLAALIAASILLPEYFSASNIWDGTELQNSAYTVGGVAILLQVDKILTLATKVKDAVDKLFK